MSPKSSDLMISGPIMVTSNLPFTLDCIININSSIIFYTYKICEMSSHNANIIYRISVNVAVKPSHQQCHNPRNLIINVLYHLDVALAMHQIGSASGRSGGICMHLSRASGQKSILNPHHWAAHLSLAFNKCSQVKQKPTIIGPSETHEAKMVPIYYIYTLYRVISGQI